MTYEPEARPGRGRAYHLPGLLAEIADAAGLSAALTIAQVKGGTRAHFPASCGDDHWLVAALGREAADKVCRLFTVNHSGGVSLPVPLGPTKLYDRARFRALEMLDAGHSLAGTAREIGVSMRGVEKWAAAERKRKAVRRAGKARQPDAGTAYLTRVYDPLKDGLVSSLAETAPALVGPRPPAPAPGANVPALPPIDLAAFPRLLAEVAEVVGIGAAVVVGTMKAGKVVHVTDHVGRGGELVGLLGDEGGAKLTAHYRAKHPGDVEILMPHCPPEAFTALAAWTVAVREDGCAAADVADWLGVTPAIVEHLCAMMRATVGSGFSFRAGFPYFEPTPEG